MEQDCNSNMLLDWKKIDDANNEVDIRMANSDVSLSQLFPIAPIFIYRNSWSRSLAKAKQAGRKENTGKDKM